MSQILNILRYILFPFSIIWWAVAAVKNTLYNKGVFKSTGFDDLMIINVGNLAVGGTGKSPLVEYLIRLLKGKYKIAVLSRGYLRESSGYLLANAQSTSRLLGDEPMQFHLKFKDIPVAVCEKRVEGIRRLRAEIPELQVVILDDAFQHRAVQPDFNILVTQYSTPFTRDFVLPVGRLRESRSGARRANMVVVSKSDSKSDPVLESAIRRYTIAPVLFSSIAYQGCYELFTGIPADLPSKVGLVTGIVNTDPILKYLREQGIDVGNHLKFPDHHNYTQKDLDSLLHWEMPIVTTEKDAAKLLSFTKELSNVSVLVLPIQVHLFESDQFDQIIYKAIEAKNVSNT